MCVLLDSRIAFVGDVIQGPRLRRVGPVEPPSMAVDPATVLLSWQRLLDKGAKVFFPGHGGVFRREQLERRLAQERAKHPEYRGAGESERPASAGSSALEVDVDEARDTRGEEHRHYHERGEQQANEDV
jgi:glyoxylase-like metal-dependent hydrolase (beta-lactamase superfamily II)